MFGKLLGAFKKRSIEEIIERTEFFLAPQLKAMKALEGNKFSLISYESVFYMLEIAEAIGGRSIVNDERDVFFLTILGSEYKPRIDKIFTDIKSGQSNREEVLAAATALKQMAREDVQSGMFNCSNYLLKNAEYLSEWYKSISTS